MEQKNIKKVLPKYCPDCGGYKGPLFFNGKEKIVKNEHCKCHNKNHGLGFDLHVEYFQQNDLLKIGVVSSGVENEWVKKSSRCPICNTYYSYINNGDNEFNVKCKNPNCPTMGFDYGYKNDSAYVIASGIGNNIADFCNKDYEKRPFSQRAPLGRSNLYI